MKKLFLIFLAVMTVISVLSVSAFAEDELDLELYSKYYISSTMSLSDCYWVMFDDAVDRGSIGDVNSDGYIDVMDCVWLIQYIAGWDHSKYTVEEWGMELSPKAADVTGDGKVNLTDVSLLMKYASGWFERGAIGGGENSNLFAMWEYDCQMNDKNGVPNLSYFDWLETQKK